MKELVFVIHADEDGGFWAEAEGLSITTQGDDLNELFEMIKDAVDGYFFDEPALKPKSIVWRFAQEVVPA